MLGAGLLLARPPLWLLDALAARFPGCVYRVRTAVPVVALTLDDGPDETTTPLILDQLRRHGARATFFLIGERVAGREHVVRQLVAEGHELGNHAMRDRPGIRLAAEAFAHDLDETHRLLAPYAPVRWARPGSGWYSAGMIATMRRRGYACALGSVYPYDATIPSSDYAARHILRNVRPGAVIVLHDGGARGLRAARTLAVVLPELRRRGYRVVTLSELAPPLPRRTNSGAGTRRVRTPSCGPNAPAASWMPKGGGPRPTSATFPQRGSW